MPLLACRKAASTDAMSAWHAYAAVLAVCHGTWKRLAHSNRVGICRALQMHDMPGPWLMYSCVLQSPPSRIVDSLSADFAICNAVHKSCGVEASCTAGC